MKHIFVVHSNITYLISLGVIRKEGLNESDVMIISDGFTCDGPIPVTVVKVEANKAILKQSVKRYIKLFYNPWYELYQVIDAFVRDEAFIAYVPVLHLIKKLVIIHPKCTEFHFIEEGTASYMYTATLADYSIAAIENKHWIYPKGITGLKQRFHHSYREFGFKTNVIGTIPLYYMNHDKPGRKFYGFSEEAHPALHFGEREVIDMKSILRDFKFPNDIYEFKNANIWIGDPDVEKMYGEDIYLKCLENKLIPAVKGSTLYVRYHYRENKFQRQKFVSLLEKHGVKYTEIDDKQIMELVFIKSTGCKCYGFMSSLLMYATMAGHASFSIADGISPMRKYVEEVIPFFSKFVTYL